MAMRPCSFLTVLMALRLFSASPTARAAEKPLMLDNGKVRLGIDLASGGSIFWFGCATARVNLLNHYDRGRFIQQSYYGRQDGSIWHDKPWRWNPVQGGDWRGKPARMLSLEVTTNLAGQAVALVSSSAPMHWASGQEIQEAVMSQSIVLTNALAHIRYRFTYNGQEEHPPAHQELPAVFIDAAHTNLVLYSGDRPWTGDALSRSVPGWPNETQKPTEAWAAFVNNDDVGLGVFFPGTDMITCYRFEGDRRTGPAGSACSYFAPVRTFAIVPGLDFQYEIWVAFGPVEDMRARFRALR